MTEKVNGRAIDQEALRSLIAEYRAKAEASKRETDALVQELHQEIKISILRTQLELLELAYK